VSFDREPIASMNGALIREVREYVRAVGERLDQGRGLWFTGDVGTGKTTLAMLISKAAMEADRTVAIYSLPRLLAQLRDTYQDKAQYSLNELIDRLSAVDLLHVDDVGAEQTSSWVLEQLYTIVNTRYEEGRAILLTTNLVTIDGDDALREQIGDRTVSRINEICGDPKPMFGEDHRIEANSTLPEPADEWGYEAPAYGETRRPLASKTGRRTWPASSSSAPSGVTRARARSPTSSPRTPTSSSASRAATTPATRSSATT
jgi:DNA replication protein DnaC